MAFFLFSIFIVSTVQGILILKQVSYKLHCDIVCSKITCNQCVKTENNAKLQYWQSGKTDKR